MKCKLVFFFLLIAQYSALYAQSEEQLIENIRSLYKNTNEQIAEAIKQSSGLYCNELVVNKHSASWRAVGNYQKKVRFWYDDDPFIADCDNPEGGCREVLKKIEENIASTYSWNYEYLFESGKLVFCFAKYSYQNSNNQEFRFYFHDNKLIRYLEKRDNQSEEFMYSKKDADKIQQQAEELMKLFLSTF